MYKRFLIDLFFSCLIQVTEKCNVWSFGVLLWEIFEFGKLPHSQLTDDQVITRVFGPEALRLPAPDLANTHV